MADWNSQQYLKFKEERTQPAIDLARRMELKRPQKVADIGCGPGNSTAVLQQIFPDAAVTGYDNSENMLETAAKNCPKAKFEYCDASKDIPKLGSDYDAVFSNACLQWLPEHKKRIPELLGMLEPGGVLAVQIPVNFEEPIHQIIGAAVSEKWKKDFPQPRVFYTLTPEEYYEILAENSAAFQMWRTTYFHVLPSHNAILEWYRSTGLKPYLDALPNEKKAAFENDIMEQVKKAYPRQKDGKVIFRFPRFFFIAKK